MSEMLTEIKEGTESLKPGQKVTKQKLLSKNRKMKKMKILRYNHWNKKFNGKAQEKMKY